MRFIATFFTSLVRMLAGLAVLAFAAGVPAYFVDVDKSAVAHAGKGTASIETLEKVYLDGSKVSAALMIADAAGDVENASAQADAVYARNPSWRAAGGDEPFFIAYLSTLPQGKSYGSVYEVLATAENRKKLSDFLSQTNMLLVDRLVKLRSLNTSILPPAYTSAGAPMEAAILTSAMLAQSGDFNPKFMRDLFQTLDGIDGDAAKTEAFEKYCLGLLTLARSMDWTSLRSVFAHFDSLGQVYEFSRRYSAAEGTQRKNLLASALLLSGDCDSCINYVSPNDERRWDDFLFAFRNGEGSLDFLLESGRQIYKDSWAAGYAAFYADHLKKFLAPAALRFPTGLLALKVLLSIFGGYLFIRGFVRMFQRRRDTPAWYSPLALLRGLLEGAVVGLTFFALFEPDAFKLKFETAEPPPEITFTFDKIINTLGEDTMKFATDSTTLAVIATFIVVQTTIYMFCLIRLANVKRLKLPPALKLKLLENDENLFDLCLYTGLAGTASSLIMLTLHLISASLMAAYTSTLLGILYTALIKIVHVRRYRSRLLLEAAKENSGALTAQSEK